MSTKMAQKKKVIVRQGTIIGRDYAARVAALKRARGALKHHGAALIRHLAQIRKERERKLP